ncbi:MAG TPA: FtsQ-type POTRA domain-containing protein [Eubacteriales bacterium]|jgi:hypothetical protein|nr:FtsQ-type POTRA domain-containing protein [Clostridia bacterium]HRR90417.1 FtsQ-type POTRA domain-containing protein [Eubacteriales bacterium]HRU84129.1 FtsQ-type POTRA domain-containing protein [Eubacteriales bacterium]
MNKRLITLLIFLAVTVVVVILNFTVFTVSSVEVKFAGEGGHISEDEILEAAAIKPANNIFTISEHLVVSRIQSKLPSVKVINIERVFPNKIIIHVAVRHPVLAFKAVGTDTFALVDREFCVVEVLESSALAQSETEDGPITKTNVEISSENLKAGINLIDTQRSEIIILQNIVAAFENLEIYGGAFSAFVSEINLDAEKLTVSTRSGVAFEISASALTVISERISAAYGWYQSASSSEDAEVRGRVTHGFIRYDAELSEFVWYAD